MKKPSIIILTIFLAMAAACYGQSDTEAAEGFSGASQTIHRQLEESLSELSELRQQIADQQIPLSRQLNELEGDLIGVRLEYKKVSRTLDNRILDLSNLRNEVKQRQEEASYLSNLLGEYIRNLETRLHIAEVQRYSDALETARVAMDNRNLSSQQVYHKQIELVALSMDRLEESLGGVTFKGHALDSSGKVCEGDFVMIGPAAIFRSEDGLEVGSAEQRLGSLEPTIIAYGDPESTAAAGTLAATSSGLFPLDPTQGNAHKIEETKQTLGEHISKGGVVMYPILGMAAASMLVALCKWLGMVTIRKPSQKRIDDLLGSVAARDVAGLKEKVVRLKGPVGKMLSTGVEHIKEPRELIEEVMYETILATKLKLQRMLPFIAISASSAPLLGLLGTVTGIINTFKLITVFGSGDVKTLSGGISEALITTEFGLIVAIPSLLLHAFLSRKAKGVIDQMEKAAVAFVNQVSKSHYERELEAATPKQDNQ